MDNNLGLRILFISVVLGLSVVSLVIFPINFGIDLKGGYTVSYLVEDEPSAEDEEPAPAISRKDQVEGIIDVMRKRVNKMGLLDIKFTPEAKDRIKVQIPGADQAEADRIKNVLTQLGRLEWRIVALDSELQQAGVDVATETARRQAIEEEARLARGRGEIGPIYTGPEGQAGELFRWYYFSEDSRRSGESGRSGGAYVKLGDETISGQDLSSVFPEIDSQSGMPVVGFRLKSVAAGKMGDLTSKNIKRQLAIILNNEIHSAPAIESQITSSGIIRGRFTAQEVEDLITTLKSGSLELKPRLLSEDLIGPTLGEDAINRGLLALGIGLAAVLMFMVLYYRVAGFIADVALFATMLIMLGTLLLFSATLTLPGIAGIILTVGMAVDANILIFERMREEKEKGKTLLQSVKNGYSQAFRAIFDSNLTTFITAVILWLVGTDVIKGFGVTLAIGILASMFSALILTKTVFLVLIQKGWLKDLHMMRWVGTPNISFLKYTPLAITASAAAIVLGLIIFFERGDDKYSIDFTGGEEIQVNLVSPMTIGQMRDEITAIRADDGSPKYPDVAVVSILVPNMARGETTRFEISSKVEEERSEEFRNDVLDSLEGKLLPEGIPVMEEISAELPEDSDTPAEFAGGIRFSLTLPADTPASSVKERLAAVELKPEPISITENEEAGASLGGGWKVYDVLARPARPDADFDTLKSQIRHSFVGRENKALFPEPITKSVTIGKVVAKDLRNKAIIAIFLSLVLMILYIRFRFHEFKYGIAAAACLAHDVIVTLGVCVLADWLGLVDVKISYAIIAVFLTIVGYSLNDTIVIFDRVRENLRRAKGSFEEIVNASINQTLSRTILTSATTLFVVIVLLVANYGQKSDLEGFSFALLVGIIAGTYSTIYVASPIVILLKKYLEKRETKARAAESRVSAGAGK